MLELQTALPGLELSDHENDNDSDIDIESGLSNKRKRKALFSKDDQNDLDKFYENIENPEEDKDEDDMGLDEDEENAITDENVGGSDDDDEGNPLITDLETVNKEEKRKLQAKSWFKKVISSNPYKISTLIPISKTHRSWVKSEHKIIR